MIRKLGLFKLRIQTKTSKNLPKFFLRNLQQLFSRKKANSEIEGISACENYLQLAPTSNMAAAIRSIIEQLKNQQNQGDTVELMPQK